VSRGHGVDDDMGSSLAHLSKCIAEEREQYRCLVRNWQEVEEWGNGVGTWKPLFDMEPRGVPAPSSCDSRCLIHFAKFLARPAACKFPSLSWLPGNEMEVRFLAARLARARERLA
jgi:hypothetical protein